MRPDLGPCQPHIGQAAFLLQPVIAAFVQRQLVGEYGFLPAGQKGQVKLQPLGRMQGHDGNSRLGLVLFIAQHQRDMLKKTFKVFKVFHGANQLAQVFKPPWRVG